MYVNLDGSQNVKRTIFYTHWIIHCINIIKLSFSFPMIPGYLKLIQKLKVTRFRVRHTIGHKPNHVPYCFYIIKLAKND